MLNAYRIISIVVIILLTVGTTYESKLFASTVYIPGHGTYEIYSTGDFVPAKKDESIFLQEPAISINYNGLGGLFVANTANRLEQGALYTRAGYRYHDLDARRRDSFRSTEGGSVSTFETSFNWTGRYAEWAVTVPIHYWSLNAPHTFRQRASEDDGLGNIRLGWKATYLPDKSYYRFAYGFTSVLSTGNPDRMKPSGAKDSEEIGVFGVVTTRETDKATANLELGAIINAESDENRFIYRLGMTYSSTEKSAIIGELAGEVLGGNDMDTLDMIIGIRLAVTEKHNLELAWHRNLRTWREYGWTDQFQGGYAIRW